MTNYHQSSRLYIPGKRSHRPKRNRFWEKVQKTEGCWVWTGAKTREGYGQFGKITAHRRSVQLAKREIPYRFHVHHECGNKLCVRPDHLVVVSPQEHRIFHYGDPRFCVRGHDMTGMNLRIGPSGNRYCRICDRQRKKRSRRRTLSSSMLA